MTQTELAQAVMHEIFAYLTAHKGKTVGPFTIKDSVVDENIVNPNGVLDGFPLQSIVLKPTDDKNCNELFYFHVRRGVAPVPVIHFHRYKNAVGNEKERIYEEQILNIITGTEDKVEIKFSTRMNLREFINIPLVRRRKLVADLKKKYTNPFYSGSLDNFDGDDLSNTVTQLMNLCFDKYIVRATLRNELANTTP